MGLSLRCLEKKPAPSAFGEVTEKMELASAVSKLKQR